ncbi:PREDICTED: CKLF-like MARVEL transmembrane domain-containing protein 4-like [Elephantulus edwardii]|uniref:CKLF-like MARVEL transmembrane domain-containing protein 4-like n=1 Tax=Elephantulus edwardii TaxID=28737 RepID=UPI0003F0D4DE|nr:PREDICTED: CKLF-like MARVEL transmembrane domain-containing protein 4-like [Elephantulus edwardii]
MSGTLEFSGDSHFSHVPAECCEITCDIEAHDSIHFFVVTLLIAFICVRSSQWANYSAFSYFEVVTMCDFIMILAFYLVHLFRLYNVLTCINWTLSEFLHYAIGTLLLLIASIVAASQSRRAGELVAGSIFGFLATVLCMLSLWMSYKISCVKQSAGSVSDFFPPGDSISSKPHSSSVMIRDFAKLLDSRFLHLSSTLVSGCSVEMQPCEDSHEEALRDMRTGERGPGGTGCERRTAEQPEACEQAGRLAGYTQAQPETNGPEHSWA